ncbi:RICIN domain-containing protein [Kitasatospora sp. NPDC004669]
MSVASGKCLNVPGNSPDNEVRLDQYTCNGTPARQRKFAKLS